MTIALLKNFIKKNKSLYTLTKSVRDKTLARFSRLTRYPTHLNFEPSTKCNSRCAYCGREKVLKERIRTLGDMEYELAERIAYEFSTIDEGRINVGLDGLGESILNPRFFDMVKVMREKLPTASLQLNTNAIGLTEEIAKKIIDSDIDLLIISQNAHNKDIYKSINQVDTFDRVIENTKRLLTLKGNSKPDVIIQILDIDENRKYFKEFEDFWRPHLNKNDKLYFRPFHDFGGSIKTDDFIRIDHKKRYPCLSLFSTIMVDKDGYIYPCCIGIIKGHKSDICLGNIKKDSLRDIYDKKSRIHELRELHKKNECQRIDACRDCNSWKVMPNIFWRIGKRWI